MPFPGLDFYMEWTDVIQDQHGKEQERRKHGQSHFKVGATPKIRLKAVSGAVLLWPYCLIHMVAILSFLKDENNDINPKNRKKYNFQMCF